MKHHPTKNIVQTIAFSLVASLGSATPAIAEDGIEVFGPLDGSFGDIQGENIIEVAAGPYHAVVLTDIATDPVRTAGWNGPFDSDTGAPCGQCDPPDFLQSVRAVAAGARHSMALLDNGTIVCWGCDDAACDVPPELADGGSNDPAVGIAAGDGFSMALLASGDIVIWGESEVDAVFEIPDEAQDPSNPAVRILAQATKRSTRTACMAILQDGTFVPWGLHYLIDDPPPGSVIVDAAMSPQFSDYYSDFVSISLLLEGGQYFDGLGIRESDPDNPYTAIFPGPVPIALLADGTWRSMSGHIDDAIYPSVEAESVRPRVSLAIGGLDYLITIPLPVDCDDDGVPDDEQIAADPNLDCDGDGRLDACRAGSHWFEAGVIAAEGDDLDLSDLPFSEAPVTISVEAIGDLEAADEFLLFDWNGGTFATAFGKNGPGEPCEAATNTFGIAPRIWNDADENGERILTVSPSFPVDPAACEESNFAITFAIEATAPSHDCNDNGIDDDCEIADGLALDVDGDRSPDECQPDCDRDGQPDAWTIFEGLVPDCNANGIPDSCDILSGEVVDADGNGIPDGCELDCRDDGDLNGDGCVGPADLGLLLSLWGTSNPVCGDLDGDGDVRAADLGILLSNWDCR